MTRKVKENFLEKQSLCWSFKERLQMDWWGHRHKLHVPMSRESWVTVLQYQERQAFLDQACLPMGSGKGSPRV